MSRAAVRSSIEDPIVSSILKSRNSDLEASRQAVSPYLQGNIYEQDRFDHNQVYMQNERLDSNENDKTKRNVFNSQVSTPIRGRSVSDSSKIPKNQSRPPSPTPRSRSPSTSSQQGRTHSSNQKPNSPKRSRPRTKGIQNRNRSHSESSVQSVQSSQSSQSARSMQEYRNRQYNENEYNGITHDFDDSVASVRKPITAIRRRSRMQLATPPRIQESHMQHIKGPIRVIGNVVQSEDSRFQAVNPLPRNVFDSKKLMHNCIDENPFHSYSTRLELSNQNAQAIQFNQHANQCHDTPEVYPLEYETESFKTAQHTIHTNDTPQGNGLVGQESTALEEFFLPPEIRRLAYTPHPIQSKSNSQEKSDPTLTSCLKNSIDQSNDTRKNLSVRFTSQSQSQINKHHQSLQGHSTHSVLSIPLKDLQNSFVQDNSNWQEITTPR